VVGIYLPMPMPMLLAAPTDVVALNFFFNTLLFGGAILLLANSIDKEPAVALTIVSPSSLPQSGKNPER